VKRCAKNAGIDHLADVALVKERLKLAQRDYEEKYG